MSDANEEGDAWLIATCLIIYITLWQFVFFLSLSSAECRPRHLFWLSNTTAGIPFNLVVYSFSLFGLWALVVIYLAHRERHRDRWTSTIVGLVCFAVTAQVLVGLNAQYESFEVEWGARERGDITFGRGYDRQFLEFRHSLRAYDSSDMWYLVRCDPEYKDPESSEEFCELLQKFDEEHNTMSAYYGGCT